MTDEDIVSKFKHDMLGFLRDVKAAMLRHGLFYEKIEYLFDKGICIQIETDSSDVYDDEHAISIIDKSLDGYIVSARKPLSSLKNTWAFQYTGEGDMYLTWVTESSVTTTMFLEKLITDGPMLIASAGKEGCWPIRDGYLPSPSKNQIISLDE